MTASAAHNLRRRDPAFAAEWAEAMETAKQMLESMLTASALGTLDAPAVIVSEGGNDYPAPPEPDPAKFDRQFAMEWLRQIRGKADKPGSSRPPQVAGEAEMADEILKRIAAVRKRRARAASQALLAAPDKQEAATDDGG